MNVRIQIIICLLMACFASSIQSAERMLSEEKACSLLKVRMAVHDGVPSKQAQSKWFCDGSSQTDEHWAIIGLHSHRQCEGICSSLRGWFAVNRKTGRVHEFDVAEMKVGPPLDKAAHRHNKSLNTDAPKDGAPVS